MLLLLHRDVSRTRHVAGAVGGAIVAATLTSLVYCALLAYAGVAPGGAAVTAATLPAAFAYGWVRTAFIALLVAALPFSVLRSLLNRLGANVGAVYFAGGALLIATLMNRAGAAASGGEATATTLLTGAVLGLTIGACYWLFAARS